MRGPRQTQAPPSLTTLQQEGQHHTSKSVRGRASLRPPPTMAGMVGMGNIWDPQRGVRMHKTSTRKEYECRLQSIAHVCWNCQLRRSSSSHPRCVGMCGFVDVWICKHAQQYSAHVVLLYTQHPVYHTLPLHAQPLRPLNNQPLQPPPLPIITTTDCPQHHRLRRHPPRIQPQQHPHRHHHPGQRLHGSSQSH